MMSGIISLRTSLFGSASVSTILGEPVALHGTTARALRHPPSRILAVYSYHPSTGARVYYAQSQWVMNGGGIARTSGSSIYDFDGYSITLSGGKYTLVTTAPRNPPLTLCLLTYVDYETAHLAPVAIDGLAPEPITGRILCAGDSITGAAHTIAREFFSSDREGYVGLIRSQFRNMFDVDNFSFDGSSIGTLTSAMPSIVANPPNVLTVAFGQNDHVAGPSGLTSFTSALTDIVDDAQGAGIRVILIGFFRKNPLWVNFSLSDALAYNEAIAGVAEAAGVSFVDIDAVWEAAKASKLHIELTGDNHHHPNNYGARIYFSAILPHLLASPVSSASVPGYIVDQG